MSTAEPIFTTTRLAWRMRARKERGYWLATMGMARYLAAPARFSQTDGARVVMPTPPRGAKLRGMKLVALALPPKDPAASVKLLCEAAGYAPAEARMRLVGEPPLVVARLEDGPAEALCEALRRAGLAVLTMPARPPGDSDRLVARSLRFTQEAVCFTPRMGPELSSPTVPSLRSCGVYTFRESRAFARRPSASSPWARRSSPKAFP